MPTKRLLIQMTKNIIGLNYNTIITIIVFLFFIAVFLENYIGNKSLQSNQIKTYATVYKIDVSSGLRGKKIFEYKYCVKGKKYSTYDFLDNYDLKVNDKILIIYDKTNPKKTEVIYDNLPLK